MANAHMAALMKMANGDNVEITAVCDVYTNRLDQAKELTKGQAIKDYRQLLESKEVDYILIATPELEPYTGVTPLGIAARRVAGELHTCRDTDIAIAMPACDGLLRAHALEFTEEDTLPTASRQPAERGPGRILRRETGTGPELFLLDAPALRNAFHPEATESALAEGALLWSSSP